MGPIPLKSLCQKYKNRPSYAAGKFNVPNDIWQIFELKSIKRRARGVELGAITGIINEGIMPKKRLANGEK